MIGTKGNGPPLVKASRECQAVGPLNGRRFVRKCNSNRDDKSSQHSRPCCASRWLRPFQPRTGGLALVTMRCASVVRLTRHPGCDPKMHEVGPPTPSRLVPSSSCR